MKLVISQEAAVDLVRLRDFLFDKNPAAAERAVSTIIQGIDSLATYPDRGRLSAEAMRELIVPFGRSVYIVRFSYDAQRQEVVIVRIWHGREARP